MTRMRVRARTRMYQRPTNGLRSLGKSGYVMGFSVSGKSNQNKRETVGEIRLSSRRCRDTHSRMVDISWKSNGTCSQPDGIYGHKLNKIPNPQEDKRRGGWRIYKWGRKNRKPPVQREREREKPARLCPRCIPCFDFSERVKFRSSVLSRI